MNNYGKPNSTNLRDTRTSANLGTRPISTHTLHKQEDIDELERLINNNKKKNNQNNTNNPHSYQNEMVQTAITHKDKPENIQFANYPHYDTISNKGFGAMLQFPFAERSEIVDIQDYRGYYDILFQYQITNQTSIINDYENIRIFLVNEQRARLIRILIAARQQMENMAKGNDNLEAEYKKLADLCTWARKLLKIADEFSAFNNAKNSLPLNDLENNHSDSEQTKFFAALNAINLYLKKRASETSSTRTVLFNTYNGKDYYERRTSFIKILQSLHQGDIDLSIELITKEIQKFSPAGLARKEYANHLKNLKSILQTFLIVDSVFTNTNKDQLNETLNSNIVKNKIADYLTLYLIMTDYTKSVIEFDSAKPESKNNVIATGIHYQYNVASKNENIQKEFIPDNKKLLEIEYKNIRYFKKPGMYESTQKKNDKREDIGNIKKI